MADKIYIGSGKERTFDNGGSIITITIDVDALINYCKDYGFTTEAGKRKIKLKVGKRRDIDQYGNTHSVEVDTWKPEPGRQSSSARPVETHNAAPGDFPDDDRIPF